MDIDLKDRFITNWNKYFGRSELPIVCYYGDDHQTAEKVKPSDKWYCLIGDLMTVRRGKSLVFNEESLGCGGAKKYLGFTSQDMSDFEYFLSCGIPGKMEGERFKKSPEIVRNLLKDRKPFTAKSKTIVFKRWDKLVKTDNPDIVIFFTNPDVLSGLFTLAGFDRSDSDSTICPFGSGCSSIVYHPYLENNSKNPRAVLGLFDPSARPPVSGNTLTFAVPMKKFINMIDCMNDSFLITGTWKKVLKRINRAQ